MAISAIDKRSAIDLAPLLTFTWGDATWSDDGLHVVRYAGCDQDITANSNLYTSEASIEIDSGPQTGSPKDEPFTVKMKNVSPLNLMTRRYPHAPVTVTVEECAPSDPDNTLRTMFKGRITSTTKNAEGFAGLVRFSLSGWKRVLESRLGVLVSDRCPWTLGDSNCCVDLETIRQTGTVTAISGRTITLSGLAAETHWQFGELFWDGLPLRIQSVSGSTFTLDQPAPPEWDGKEIRCTPGDDKTYTTCRDRYNNVQRFGGIGIRMPDYHPQMENPG